MRAAEHNRFNLTYDLIQGIIYVNIIRFHNEVSSPQRRC
jgi:hypothetical protein